MRLSDNDIELLKAFREGKGTAYEAIYEYYIEGLFVFADHMVRDTQVAEDIAIQALAKSFTRHQDFETLAKLKSFLFTTANNAALDYIKTQKRHSRAHQEIKYLQNEMDDAELNYIRSEAILAVNAAIEALPSQLQRVIRLSFVEGKKLTEVAAEMQLSYNTVQNYKARALELMRLHLLENKWLTTAGLWLTLSLLENN